MQTTIAKGEQVAESPAQDEKRDAAESDERTLKKLNTNVHVYDGRRLTFPYQVAPGRKLRTVVGELVQGARVTAELVGGQEVLNRLVEQRRVLRAAQRNP